MATAAGQGPARTPAWRKASAWATLVRDICEDGVDHYGVALRDPEGNEFDIN